MTDSKVLFDTSAWLAFFDAKDDKQVHALIADKVAIYTSVLTLFEMKRKFLKGKVSKEFALKYLDAIHENSILVEVTDIIALIAAEDSAKYRLPAVDALIYATAQEHSCTLITFDNDFRNLKNKNVKVLKGVD